ncbi:MAG: ATP-binding protein [bacterium]
MSSSLETQFAPPERADAESISRDAQLLMESALLEHLTTAVPCVLLILNPERQIVYKNQRTIDLLGTSAIEEMLGKRPGEMLHCVHACESQAGCGTTEFCRECGAVNTVLQSQAEGATVVSECRISTVSGGAYEFRVWASPYRYGKKDFTLFTLLDISNEKRRNVLERTFFHDVINILNVVVGCSQLLEDTKDVENVAEYIKTIQIAANELVEEISSHRRLLQAENGELSVTISKVVSLSLLREVKKVFSADENLKNREIVVDAGSDGAEIATDRVLLRRVLTNMVKNALEATAVGKEVRLACERSQSSIVFSVHNPGHMPRSVQLQVFHRSFSTKGKGRGIGTYSMKLFGEKYLKGKVWFSSTEDKGTTFYLSLPLEYPAVDSK